MHLVANFDQSAVDRGLSAVDVIREMAPIVGGGGGGRPTMARAGGSDPDALEQPSRRRARWCSTGSVTGEGARARLRPGPHRCGRERRHRHAGAPAGRGGAGALEAGPGGAAAHDRRARARAGGGRAAADARRRPGQAGGRDALVRARARERLSRSRSRPTTSDSPPPWPTGCPGRTPTRWPPPTSSKDICSDSPASRAHRVVCCGAGGRDSPVARCVAGLGQAGGRSARPADHRRDPQGRRRGSDRRPARAARA